MVDEIEVSENKEVLIVLAGTVAGATTTFVAFLRIPLEIKALATELATTVTGRILLSGETYDMMEQFCLSLLDLRRSVGRMKVKLSCDRCFAYNSLNTELG